MKLFSSFLLPCSLARVRLAKQPERRIKIMTRFYQPDLSEDIDSPFARDGADKLVRRSNWLDMNDRTIVVVMVTFSVLYRRITFWLFLGLTE